MTNSPNDSRRTVLVSVAVGFVVLAVIALVAFGDESSPRDPMTGETEFDIPVQDPTLVADGAGLYQARCAVCHGSDLRGTDFGPSHLSVVYQPGHHSDGSFAVAALAGVRAHHWNFGDMEPVPGLSETDLIEIVAYVREVQRVEGFEIYPPR
jgi:mono/diheme cytochrome c family protein